MRKAVYILSIGTLFSLTTIPVLGQQFTGKPQYQIEVRRDDTVMGKIIVELFPAIAPNSVRNWDSLVTIHFYDSTAFHRVIPGFVIQGGDPNSRSGPKSTWGYGDPDQTTVDAEFSAVSHRRGILSAARASDPNSATSQFFICVAPAVSLDRKYSVYGHVVKGMEVVDSVVNAKCDASDDPLVKISMFITRLGSNDSLESVPALASPADGSSNGTATKATLRWHHVSDAMMYRIQLATDNAFSNIVADTTRSQADTSVTVTKLHGKTTYYWRVLANNGGFASEFSEPWKFDVASLGVSDEESQTITLEEASPNPSMGDVLIRFHLNKESYTSLLVFDILGREVLRLLDEKVLTEGDHEVIIPHSSLLPGAYLYRLQANDQRISKRMIMR